MRCLDSIVRLLGAEAQMKNARIETHFQKKLPLFKIDVSQFSLALSNLLINSIQAVSDQGEIHLLTRASKKNVFVVIQDNGMGISEEHLPKIFDFMFSTKPTGSGLGLSIAKKIISDHHGEISVKSETQQGLPLYHQNSDRPQDQLKQPWKVQSFSSWRMTPTSGESIRLLLAEEGVLHPPRLQRQGSASISFARRW